MPIFKTCAVTVLTAATALFSALPAFAQPEEIVVTGMRRAADAPGVVLEKQGDFFLLQLTLENDRRLAAERLPEIRATMEAIVEAAKADPSISLSIIDENNLVRPLTAQGFEDGIRSGNRPDTSVANIQLKTAIPATVTDSYVLATKLTDFADDLDGVGRTTVNWFEDVQLSVVNPRQYRSELIRAITSEIRQTTTALGDDYRVILDGLDGEMKWSRGGDVNLIFHLPYEFIIIPTSITTIPYEN